MVMSGAPLEFVGVFQNHNPEFVADTANQLKLSAVQLHGNEDQAYVDTLKPLLNDDIKVWKAHGVTDELPDLNRINVDRHLLDAKVGEQSGGTGTSFDWQLLNNTTDIMLAGGLSPENVKQASELGCIGLDLNSGVESAPGKKDAEKLNQAFALIRDY
jgi:indole-3-glycerol phosphate synthase/phosphoribosylanthranilate isomerase